MNGPLLRTERLELWQPRPDDLRGLVELIDAEETRRFLGPTQPSVESQFGRLLRNGGSWHFYGYGTLMVRLASEGAIIGSCGIFHTWRGLPGMDDVPEAGWIIRHDYWGQGIAREAMDAVLAWFDVTHGPRRVTCMIEEGNVASDRLARGLGFAAFGRDQFEGTELVLYQRLAC